MSEEQRPKIPAATPHRLVAQLQEEVPMLCPYWWCLEDGYTCEHGAVINTLKLALSSMPSQSELG